MVDKSIEAFNKLIARMARVGTDERYYDERYYDERYYDERYYLCSDRSRYAIPDEHWVKKKYDDMKSFKRGKLPYQFIKIFPHVFIHSNGVAAKRVIHGASQKFNFVFSKTSQVIEMSELIATRAR